MHAPRYLVALATLVALARPCLAAESSTAAVEPARPANFVVIVADDLGFHSLGCYGNEQVISPNIDRIANEGTRLTSFYVTWPACTPSRGSILTGRYPQRNGLYDMIRNDMVNYGHKFDMQEYSVSPEATIGMDTREVMISVPLHEVGYTSAVVGKWDGGRARRFLPLQRGFDFYYGFANTGIDYFTHERYGVPSMFRGNELTTADRGAYATELFEREALDFVRKNADRPFFLYLPFNAPHGASNLDKSVGVQADDASMALYKDRHVTGKSVSYYAAITRMDQAVGKVLDLLDELKLADNTLVLFLSDNGGTGRAENTPLNGGKSSMFEGGVRVACLARLNGRIPAGGVCDEFLTSLEIYPTMLALAQAKPPSGVKLDGFDMLPVLEGKIPSGRKEMFWQRRDERAARVGNYKWFDSEDGTGLFDLSTDLGETHDLSKERPDILKMVTDRFATWRAEMDAAEPRGPFRDY